MTETPHPDSGLTEETRHMFTDTYSKVFNGLIDDIIKPVRPVDRLDDHGILIDELGVMYEAHMTIGGQQNRFNASVIRAAINVIASISKV